MLYSADIKVEVRVVSILAVPKDEGLLVGVKMEIAAGLCFISFTRRAWTSTHRITYNGAGSSFGLGLGFIQLLRSVLVKYSE